MPIPFARLPRRTVELPDPPSAPRRYRLRISLVESSPEIWRVVSLRSDATLDAVHELIQAAMGWEDYHLHAFVVGAPYDYQAPRFVCSTGHDDWQDDDLALPEEGVRLDQILRSEGESVSYEYDFGDSWWHTLTLEAIEGLDPANRKAALVDGERACPPEDCGGIGGYAEIQELLEKPLDDLDEHQQQIRTWLPEDYDPAHFDRAAAERRIALTRLAEPLDGIRLAPDLDAMLDHLGSQRIFLVELLLRALRPGEPATPPDSSAAPATLGFLELLRRIPDKGLKLTAAGYLPPAIVGSLYDACFEPDPWYGTKNREDQTLPVLRLRESATAVGLVRKARGYLYRTAAGTAVLADPSRLVDHLTKRLPVHRAPGAFDAGWLSLVVIAGTDLDADPDADADPAPWDTAANLMSGLGWQIGADRFRGKRIDAGNLRHIAGDTIDVLRSLGGLRDRHRAPYEPVPTAYGREIARRALTR